MQDGFGTSAFVLDPSRVGNALSEVNRNRQYDREWNYRLGQEQQAEDWKKANLIQDLTDLSKYQTGSDIANSIGNQQANNILQKYSEAAKNLSFTELQAKIQQEMSGLKTGLGGLQTELDLSDAQLKALKQQYPDLDYSRLAREYRGDILERRLQGNNFKNPLEVGPTERMRLDDPEFLSQYLTSNKELMNEIINPSGAENESVLVGKQGDYTKFEGKLDYFKEPTYDRAKFDKEGFYSGKEMPSFKVKGHALPSDAMPSSNGKPFMVIDESVYNRFLQNDKTKLGIIKAAREVFPNYDSFNRQEKEYAQRNVLYRMANDLNQSQLHPTFSTKPPRTTVHVGGRGGSDDDVKINNLYKRIDDLASQKRSEGKPYLQLNLLSGDGQKMVMSLVKDNGYDDFNQSDVYVKKDDNGLGVYHATEYNPGQAGGWKKNQLIGFLDRESVNQKVQPGVKEKRADLKQGKGNNPNNPLDLDLD